MEILGLASVPSHTEELRRLSDTAWPAFLLHGDVRGWDSLFDDFAQFQTVLVESGELIGAGLTAPCPWRVGDPLPESIDAALARAEWPLPTGSGVLLALAAIVVPAHRGRGFSRDIIRAMGALARREGLAGVLAPVRPTRKHEFPEMSIEEYADWRRDGAGRLVDPWLRVHEELGGRRLGIAARALTVRGTLGEWESWTGLHFAESGPHPVPGALVPVQIDRECDLGEYVEPNVWYVHSGDALGR